MTRQRKKSETGDPALLSYLRDLVLRVGPTVLSQLALASLKDWLENPAHPTPPAVLNAIPDLMRAAASTSGSVLKPGHDLPTTSRFSRDRTGVSRFKMRRFDQLRTSAWTPPPLQTIPKLDPDLLTLLPARDRAAIIAESVSNVERTHPYDNKYGIFGFKSYSEFVDTTKVRTKRTTNRSTR